MLTLVVLRLQDAQQRQVSPFGCSKRRVSSTQALEPEFWCPMNSVNVACRFHVPQAVVAAGDMYTSVRSFAGCSGPCDD